MKKRNLPLFCPTLYSQARVLTPTATFDVKQIKFYESMKYFLILDITT